MLKIITSFDTESKKEETNQSKKLNNKFQDLIPKPIDRDSDHNLKIESNESE